MAVSPVVWLAANSQDLSEITECPSTMYGAPIPTLIAAKDIQILNNSLPLPGGAKMVS